MNTTTNYGNCQRCSDPIVTNSGNAHCAPCLAALGRKAVTSHHPDTSSVVSGEANYPAWRAWMAVRVGPSCWYVMVDVIGERELGHGRREYRVQPVDARVVDGMVHWVDGRDVRDDRRPLSSGATRIDRAYQERTERERRAVIERGD